MLLRVWCFGQEILTIQLVRQDPTELLAAAVVEYQDDDDDELGDTAPIVSWPSSDPDDESHLILRPPDDVPDIPDDCSTL